MSGELYRACHSGNKDKAQKLICSNFSPHEYCHAITFDYTNGDTPLHQACKQGWLDIVKQLIEECGCNPYVLSRYDHQSLLHYACWYGHIDIFEYLYVKQHLNPLLKDDHLLEPLDYALNSKTSIAVYICQHCITSDEMLDPKRIKTTINVMKNILIMNPFDPKWKTANGDNILQLVGSSELCISCIPSVVVLEMLKNLFSTSINSNVFFQPEWRTADGDSLLQLVCESKTCLSKLSSAVILGWLKHVTLRYVNKSIPDCKTADGDALLQLVLKSEECLSQVSSKALFKWLNSTTLDFTKLVTPDWKTMDGDTILKVVCVHKKIVSQIPSAVLSKWLSTCAIYLPNVIKPNMKTADGDTLLQLVCQSETCLSQIPSVVLLEWVKACDISLDHQDFEKCILSNRKTADGYTLIQLVCYSEICLSKISSVALFRLLTATTLDISSLSTRTQDSDKILLQQVCESKTCVSQISSLVMSKWLSDATLGLVEIITPDNKTANGDTLLQLVCQSDICLLHLSSATLLKWLNNATIDDMKTALPKSKTADGDSFFQLVCQSESCLSLVPSVELIKWLNDASLDKVKISLPDSKTADGDALLQLVCQSNESVSQISSDVMSQWLRDTTLELAKIIKPHSETADGDSLLQLVCQSKSCLSQLSSAVLKEWLSCTTLHRVNISIPDAKTSDGDALLQLVCRSKEFVSKISSKVLSKWISDTSLDLAKVILPDHKTADGDTLLKLVCQIEKCLSHISSAVVLEWLSNTSLELDSWVKSTLDAKTADDEPVIQLVYKSEMCVSQIPSAVLLKWLNDTTIDITKIIIPHYTTTDGNTVLELICQSEVCLSRISSSIFLNWLTRAHLKVVCISLPDSKTAENDTLLELILQSVIFISRISSIVLSTWLSDSKQITIAPIKMTDPNWKTLDGDCFVHALCQSKVEDERLIELLQYYSKKNVWNPDVIDSKGNTALHIVCEADKPNVVSFLLNEGHCNPNIRNNVAKLPLDMTINPKIIDLFSQNHQIIISSKTISGWMNKWWVYDVVMLSILKVLVHNHRYKTSDGSTLLHLMCHHLNGVFRNKITLVDYLLTECQNDPNCLDSEGLIPLQLTSDSRIMIKLIEYGAKLTSDVVFKVVSSIYITDSTANELFTISTRKGTMLWNPDDLNSNGDTALHLACKHNKPITVKFILTEAKFTSEHFVLEIVSARDGNGYTALHLACRAGNSDIVNLLLSATHCDPNVKSKSGEVPLQMTTNRHIIIDLIRHGAETNVMYESYKTFLGTNKPIKPPVKVFIVGNPSVGKSTLTAALKKKIGVIARFFSGKVSGVDKKTVGIVPHDLENDIFGRVTLYDFAGHREFYSGHAALLQTAIQSTPPIFLLVVNLREEDDEILKTILYWVSFLENQCASVSCKPHIILVGSHADTLKEVIPTDRVKMIIDSLDTKCFTNMDFVGFVAIDCQYHESSGMNYLRNLLVKSCSELRIHEPITFNAHCFLVYLISTFAKEPAVTIKDIRNKIKQQMQAQTDKSVIEFLPQSYEALYKICMELNNRGHILLLKDRIAAENSYVVTDKEFLLSDISGTVFATKDFKQYKELSTNTGVVPLSKIAKCFPDKDLNILIGFLTHLEFCHGISDQALHQLLSEQYSQSSDEQYYLFPGLISLKADDTVWKSQSEYTYNFGWILKCVHPEQFFSSRFLQVLLLRLAFSFALEISCDSLSQSIGIHRNCYIWKNGIFWGSRFGMQTLVEVTSDNKSVVLLTRFQSANLLQCAQHRSEVIHTILQCKKEFCPRLFVMEIFIDSSSPLNYPLSLTSKLKICSLQDLATAIVSDYECPSVVLQCTTIPAKNFLSFEPYLEMKLSTLQQLCDEKNESNVISDRYLSVFAEYAQVSEQLTLFLKVLPVVGTTMTASGMYMKDDNIYQKLLKWRDSDIHNQKTYSDLRQLVDQYSVFAGRNVLVS